MDSPSTGNGRRIPITKSQSYGKAFHVVTSSWHNWASLQWSRVIDRFITQRASIREMALMRLYPHVLPQKPGPRFNIKMSSYQYILRPSYLHIGISHTCKMTSLYWTRALDRREHKPFINQCIQTSTKSKHTMPHCNQTTFHFNRHKTALFST